MKKISQRLAGSDVFSADFEYKQRLIQTADRKLEKCKIPGGQELDQQCVDRAVGQIMQMIANIENNGH